MRVHLQDFRVGWRLLMREPMWSSVIIVGLAIGFAVCFLLTGFVRYSLSYDSHIPGNEWIYLVKTRFHFPGIPEQWTERAPLVMRDTISNGALPAVSTVFGAMTVPVRVSDSVLSLPITVVDQNFPAVFGIEVRAGSLDTSLNRPDAIALTEESARKLFGSDDVVGRTITIHRRPFTVAAVVDDPPITTTAGYEALVGAASNIWNGGDRDEAFHNWGRLFGRVYIKMEPNVDVGSIEVALQAASDRSPLHTQLPPELLAHLGTSKLMDVKLVRLSDVYLDPDLTATAKSTEHGNRLALWGLSAIAVVILLLAAINYINLATVRSLRRQREIGVRKVLGASVSRVAAQFIGESVLVTLLSTATGLFLAWWVLPIFAGIMNRRLEGLFTLSSIAIAAVLAIVVGLLSGIYPAWVAARVRATRALAGRDNQESSGGLWVRRVLTVAQFATAMGLTAVTSAIAWQTWHNLRLDPGFDANTLLVVDIAPPFTPSTSNTVAFAAAVAQSPGVGGAALSMEAVGRSFVIQKSPAKRAGGAMITVEKKGVGVGYFDVHNIALLSGRGFTRGRDGDPILQGISDRVVLSATAAKQLGFRAPSEAIGKSVEMDGTGKGSEVIGVVSDIRHQSAREEPLPVVYRLSSSTPVLSVRVVGDMAEAQRSIEQLWPSFFPDNVLKMTRAQAFLDARYAEDIRLTQLLMAGTFIAIAVAAFGVYVLAAYSVQRLVRQIIIRKLYGADRMAIIKLAGRELIVALFASAVVCLPLAAIAIQRYLAGFAEPAPIGAWTLVFAVIASVFVAAAAASRHIAMAVRLRPVEALRA